MTGDPPSDPENPGDLPRPQAETPTESAPPSAATTSAAGTTTGPTTKSGKTQPPAPAPKKSEPPTTSTSPTLAAITDSDIPVRIRAFLASLAHKLDARLPLRVLVPAVTGIWRQANEVLLRAYVRAVPSEQNRLFVLTVVIGGVCGVAAVLFHLGLALGEKELIDRAMNAPAYWWVPLSIFTLVAGAAMCGVLLQYFFPAARGSGIPQVKVVFAIKSGRLRLRDALAKFVIGIIQIGSGSSLGREGPTVHICAGIAGALGRLFALSPQNMRRLIPVGAAAGIAAAFNAPIAAVTFTTEEIVGDLDQTVLSGVVVAAALAAVIERTVLGEQPIFSIGKSYELTHLSSLVVYALIGVAAAGASHLFTVGLLDIRLWFRKLKRVPGWLQPAIGAFGTGVVACAVYATVHAGGVTGGGYETLDAALNGNIAAHVMIILCGAKLVATLLSYSSGGAGGIFAPALFVGGMLGGAFSFLDSWALGHTDTQAGAFALVGMGAVFAGVIRAPITSFLIIFEMTNGYGLILPLMIANTTAYALARKWHRKPIYEALIEQDGIRLPHKSGAAAHLSALHVESAMTTTNLITLNAGLTVRNALEAIAGKGFSAYPVLEPDGAFAGVLSEAKLRRLVAENQGDTTVREQLRARETLKPDQPLLDAVARMNKLGVRQMAVVDAEGKRLVGMFAMSDVMRAHARAVDEAQTAEAEA